VKHNTIRNEMLQISLTLVWHRFKFCL